MKQPTSEEVKKARAAAGLTQKQAAVVIHKDIRAWQRYEAGDRRMDAALYELFLLKTGQIEVMKMKHYSFEEIVELAKTEPRKQLRLHWEGEQQGAKAILVAHIVADVADGMYTAKEFDDMGYCVSEEDWQAEQDEADYQNQD